MRKETDPSELEEEVQRPVDVRHRTLVEMTIARWQPARCQWCGREVREDWTPAESPDEQLCARCRQMVRDPDALKPGGAA
jgi:hypothetical protein